ncbi:NUDIX hydrolase [Deinococcus pimensis]|uniref:NUDIX hydrolase n=1 Tax=Deinococcus pimensis TaxID=309888 RepID=UPI000485C7EF|nr:8-oxo-dGTP diphosphatase [Deinococcus pimensis]
MPYEPIVGTLGYVLSPDGARVLLVHRNARAEDEHLGKYNGLGGKLEAHESVTEGLRRELMEEAGLTVTRMRLRGTISWPGFGKNGEDWLGFIFVVDAFEGEPPASNAEGTLSWEPVERLLSGELPVWEGDRFFLPLLFDTDPRAFHGVMPYHEGRPVDWRFERL